jgi:preprotein translocase subunit SecY
MEVVDFNKINERMYEWMSKFILFLHILGAVGMGFYLVFPILTARITALSKQAQEGYVQALVTANRFGQILLIVQLLTGGYLIGKYKDSFNLSPAWMASSIVLLILAGAFSGMVGGPLKRIVKGLQSGESTDKDAAKIKLFSILLTIILIAIIVLMVYPEMLAKS